MSNEWPPRTRKSRTNNRKNLSNMYIPPDEWWEDEEVTPLEKIEGSFIDDDYQTIRNEEGSKSDY